MAVRTRVPSLTEVKIVVAAAACKVRRADGGLLGGKDPAGRFLRPHDQSSFRILPMLRFLVNSELLLLPNRSR